MYYLKMSQSDFRKMPSWELDNVLKELGEFLKNNKQNQGCPFIGSNESK